MSNNSPEFLVAAHQTEARAGSANRGNIIPNFDDADVKEYFVEIDGTCCLKDFIDVEFVKNDYLNQHRDLKLFYKQYVGETLLKPFITYLYLKIFYVTYVLT